MILACGSWGLTLALRSPMCQMPWRMSSDLKRFRALTIGKPVIMGRKTFQSLGKPLAGRDNIVVTRNARFSAQGAIAARGLATALDIARQLATRRGVDEIMVVGGSEIYRMALPLADRVYLTRVHASPPGDAMFDGFAAGGGHAGWVEVSAEACAPGPRDDHAATFLIFDRNSTA